MEKALSSERPPAYGATTLPELTLGKMVGQPHDADYALLSSIYRLNTDVSGCVHKWAGGVNAQIERVCLICGPLHGERREAGEQYYSGLKPAFAHIQCRCSEVGLVDAEAA